MKKEERDTTSDKGLSVSELLLELDFIKRELYSQINYGKAVDNDKKKLKEHLKKMEDEMQMTIETYRGVIESYQTDDQSDIHKLKHEISQM